MKRHYTLVFVLLKVSRIYLWFGVGKHYNECLTCSKRKT